jgi:hypothetical protein
VPTPSETGDNNQFKECAKLNIKNGRKEEKLDL